MSILYANYCINHLLLIILESFDRQIDALERIFKKLILYFMKPKKERWKWKKKNLH